MPLTYDQFRYSFANAVSEEEAKQLYEEFAVPTPGKPLFQAATANLNPWTEAKVDTKNPQPATECRNLSSQDRRYRRHRHQRWLSRRQSRGDVDGANGPAWPRDRRTTLLIE